MKCEETGFACKFEKDPVKGRSICMDCGRSPGSLRNTEPDPQTEKLDAEKRRQREIWRLGTPDHVIERAAINALIDRGEM